MATKRRKVWVNEWAADEDGPASLGPFVWQTKAAALSDRAANGTAVLMVERLPGDVVLSREDVKWLLSKALVTDFESADDRSRTLALLRGRR
jgi:hypothetical protein